ncbi:protein sprouty homolog 2 [Thalassophryne amazonica]|uniref:protein sprouty homolog 2 n=1 Tax=Thalassophryne amazonica TaxID=390379 RepID=UPI001471B98E|nr:protein sprouty homolog 2 [Thalassophryne amazonica]XP_034031488.1 protein sprouty homolog 2 [Thalassophryne amazonica]
MESRSQNDSDGGGGHYRWSPLLTGMPHDEGRPHATHAFNTPQDPGLADGQQPTAPTLLSLHQIRITRSSNEYTEGPTAAQRSPASQHRQQKGDLDVVLPAPRTSEHLETVEERPNNLWNLVSLTQHGSSTLSISSREGVLGSFSVEDTQSSIRTSMGSTSSGHRLLSIPTAGGQIIRTQPKCIELSPDELKLLHNEPGAVVALPGSGESRPPGKHRNQCEECGRCQCPECSRPRLLPSCWLCNHRCVCSGHTAVDYGTCVCCIKGIFYHCSSDDEDTCADKPFSCTQAHCCVRWTTVSLLSILFPCILCYLPAKGCVAVLQSCYDRAVRPGCRCKNTNSIHCEAVGKPA